MRAVDEIYRRQEDRSRPADRVVVRRHVFGTVTAAAWTLYAYLWLPAVTLVAWLLGLRTAWVQAVLERASVDVDAMWLMVALVVLLGCALLLWAERQRRRFTGVERRLRAPDASPEEVAASLGAADGVLAGLHRARVVTVHHDPQGRPVRVVANAPGAGVAHPRMPAQRVPVEGTGARVDAGA